MSLSKTATAFLTGILSLVCLIPAFAQGQTRVTGTVRDEGAQPVIAASVQVQGTTKGVLTDTKGQFTIEVPNDAILVVTSLGYQSQTFKAQRTLDIILKASSTSLNDVVVIGYGTSRRKEVTGAIAVVSSKDFQKGSITTPEQLIAGKVAGVSIAGNSGSPGAGSTVRIRGSVSLNASNDPLYVVDGVPLNGNNIYGASNPLSTINPNDIESMTVLKDAASTAIYGSRASNGVIIITTRKGAAGKPVFNFSTQYSVGKVTKELPVLSADQFRKYVTSLDTVGHTFVDMMGNANTDWQKEIFHAAQGTDNNLSVSGSLKHMPYRVSVGYLDQEGIVKTDRLARQSVGVSLSPRFFDDHLKVDVNLKGSLSQARFANGGAVSSAMYFDPTQPVHATSPFGNYYEWATIEPNGDINLNKLAPRNPVALLDLYRNTSNVSRSYGNVQFDYKFHFLPELHANLNLGYDVAKGSGHEIVPAYAAQNWLDTGRNTQYANKVSNQVAEFYLNYTKDLKSIKSNINVTAGYGYYNNLETKYNFPFIRYNGDTVPNTQPKYPYDKPQTRLLSYYGRLIYTFNQKYILAASLRTDGSSRFGPDERWGLFPSVALTWRVNQEAFLKDARVLSDLKLRLSYGVTGNQDGIDPYAYQANYAFSDNSSKVQLGNTWYNMASPAAYDAHLKWEQTASSNIGLDYGFLDNRISGAIDVYYKKTKDLLNVIPIPAGSNFNSVILTNVGNVTNKGVEFSINASPIRTKHVQWNVGFNVAYNDNTITNLTAVNDPSFHGTANANGIQINSVGYQINAFYVYKQLYDKAGKPIEGVFEDLNHDGVINQDDLYHYKSPNARYIYGFSTDLTVDRWSLNTVLRANTGNYMYNGLQVGSIQANSLNPLGYLANSLDNVLYTGFVNGQKLSDYYVQNASFLRMDNLGIGYDAGAVFNKKVGLRLNANVQNVFVITKYKGQDPELIGGSGAGMDFTVYPRPRTYSIGANLRF